MDDRGAEAYQALTLAQLADLLAGADESRRWRLVAEFLEEYRWEPPGARLALLAEEPPGTGDAHWGVFLAALAEHLSARDGRAGPPWAETRSLRRFWFPFNTRAARAARWSMRRRRPGAAELCGRAGTGGRVTTGDRLLNRQAMEEAFRVPRQGRA